MAKAKSIAQEMVETQSKLYEGAEELLQKMARGETVAAEEQILFDSLNWRTEDVERELGRVQDALRLREKAGTSTEFEAAKRRADEAAERLRLEGIPPHGATKRDKFVESVTAMRDSSGGPILDQIKSLAAEVEQLIAEEDKARRELFAMQQAREILPRTAPEFCKRKHRRQVNQIQHLAHAVRDAKFRKTTIERLLTLNPDRDGSYAIEEREGGVPKRVYADAFANTEYDMIIRHGESLQRDGQQAPFLHVKQHDGRDAVEKLVHVPTWNQYLEERRAELAEIEAKLPSLEAEYAAALAEVDATLEYYLKD